MRPLSASLLCLFVLTVGAAAQDKEKGELNVGDKAPVFEAMDAHGTNWKSTDHVGTKFIVVYFYPGDFTPGCTAQAKKFQENMNKLYDQGAEVVGISGDSSQTHVLFTETYKLTYTLLSDETGKVAKKFGVPITAGANVKFRLPDKTMLEFKRESTLARWTFVIDRDGKIVYKNTKVNPLQDSEKIQVFLEGVDKK